MVATTAANVTTDLMCGCYQNITSLTMCVNTGTIGGTENKSATTHRQWIQSPDVMEVPSNFFPAPEEKEKQTIL